MPQRCVLMKYGEMALEGRNRSVFERHLERNAARMLSDENHPARIERRGNVLVASSGLPVDELTQRARDVMGISVVQPALRVPKTPDDAAYGAALLIRERFAQDDGRPPPRRFAVRARRRHKEFPMTSGELAAHVGAHVQRQTAWPVDLRHPDVEIAVEVDHKEVFVSMDRHRGQGGLPVGSSGTAVVLLSGGFDSPVAAYRAVRRGLRCDFVHFTGAPLTGPSSAYKAYALARQLDRFQGDSRLHVIPMGTAQRVLATAGAGELQIVAQRRLMVRTAAAVAREIGARRLLTAEISALPDEDCCRQVVAPGSTADMVPAA